MNWFDICIVIVIIYCTIKGYKTGLVKQLATLGGLVAGAILSGKLSILVLPYIEHIKAIPQSLIAPLAYIITFGIIMIGFFILGKMLEEILKTMKMGFINKLAGIALCLTKWIFAISIAINLISQADKDHQIILPKIQNGSATYKHIEPLAPKLIPFLNLRFNDSQKTHILNNDN